MSDDLFEAEQDRESVLPTSFSEALSQRYLSYALSTITARSLPDVRDGLKPVHRRILYAMRQMRLDPEQGFKKSARVVGDVMGKFHPHGDAAIYDAMVRLAQEFAMRYRLVDGQGNFGNVDGDNPAAMRYTEARMTKVAQLLLDGIDEDTVEFRDTYDGESQEPCLLPAGFPNLLANGAQGIAVGMATSIPPHNVCELADAALHLIKAPRASFTTLLKHVKGPDFPTGGIIVEPEESVLDAYRTGRGGFRVRARWEAEKQKGGASQIVIKEIPYQVTKSKLIERMADMLQARKLPYLADIRDESTDDIRIVLEPKSRRLDNDVIMESLFRVTDLEVRVPLNLNVLDAEGRPGVMSLRDALNAWLAHRREVLVRRSDFRLGKIAARLDILEGYLVVYLNIDEVIAIIRNADHPRDELMERFGLTQVQATAILDMRLRSLRKLEQIAIETEKKELVKEQKELKALVGSKKSQWDRITKEVKALRAEFGPKGPHGNEGRRRTDRQEPPALDVDSFDELVEREPITVICSRKGWVRASRGHQDLAVLETEAKFKEGDGHGFSFHAMSTDKVLLFAENGRFYTLSADRFPSGRGYGEPVSLMIDLPAEMGIVNMFVASDRPLLVAASTGHGFIAPGEAVMAQTRNGRQVLRVKGDAKAVACRQVEGDMVACVSADNRKLLVFGVDELPTMTSGRGVILQRHKTGALTDARTYSSKVGLTWKDQGGRNRTEPDMTNWHGRRGGAGRVAPRGFPRPARFT